MSSSHSVYNSRSDSILNDSMKYNGRVNTLEINENPDARFEMYEKIAVKNKATEYRQPLSNEYENNASWPSHNSCSYCVPCSCHLHICGLLVQVWVPDFI